MLSWCNEDDHMFAPKSNMYFKLHEIKEQGSYLVCHLIYIGEH